MTTQGDVSALGWQRGSRRQALHALARAAGFGARPVRADTSGGGGEAGGDGESDDGESISALVDAAGAMGLDVEAVDLSPSGLLPALRNAAPLLLGLPRQRAFLAVLRVGVRTTTLVVEGGRRVRVPTAALTDALWAPLEAETNPGAPSSRTILADAGLASIPAGRRRAAARVLRTPGLVGRPLTEGWIVRPVLTTLGDSLRGARVRRRFAGIVAAYLAQFLLFLALWKQVGARAFDGGGEGAGAGIAAVRFLALLGGWVLIQLAASAAVSRLALDVGAAVRSGLMRGAMRLDRDRMRAAGMGQLLGRAIDAEVLDTLALGGGVEAMAGLFQIAFGAAVLGWGATPGWSLAMLAAVLAAVGVTARGHARRLSSWCDTRRALTHDLVERMIGHRTALVQDRPTARAAADET
ncbi:MAG: hypothetical protein ABUR63_07530, partial [Verrucomicrobiota bacterium]